MILSPVPVKSMKPCESSTGEKAAHAAGDSAGGAGKRSGVDWESYTPPVAHRLGVQEVEAQHRNVA